MCSGQSCNEKYHSHSANSVNVTVRGGVCFPDRPERSNKTPTDVLPQISFSGSTDTRGQISECPAEVTDIGNYNSFKA